MQEGKNSKNISWDDPHSFSNPWNMRLSHLNLNLVIDWEARKLKGFAFLTLEKTGPSDTLILDTKNLNILKIDNSKGKGLKYWLGDYDSIFGKALYIITDRLGNKQKEVRIFYETTDGAEALQWVSPEQTHDKKEPFLYSQSQAILARTWVPCQDVPAVKFTYEATVKTKVGYMALMSATNPQKLSSDGTYHFTMEQPISSYLLALSSGELDFKSLGPDCGIYAERGMLDKAVWEFADMQKMIDEAGKLYGKYMWKRYDVLVLPPSFPFGGMENPRLTFATPTVITGDRGQVSLIAHELAHSWSGNLVTNAGWDDFWLNEGFTNYFEQRIMEQIYGKPYDEMRQLLAWNDLQKTIAEMESEGLLADTKLKLNLKGRNPDDGLSDIAYDKGRFFLCHLESVVGKDNWDQFLKKYFSEHAYSFMDTEEFILYLNKELLGENEEWKSKAMVDAWVYGVGLPKNAKKPVSDELNRVDEMLAKYFTGNLKAENFDTTGFTTHHWQYLIRQFGQTIEGMRGMIKTVTVAGKSNDNVNGIKHLETFDQVFKFSNRSNAEICCDWFALSVSTGYSQNKKQIEAFLTSVGRRKFLMPIYKKMVQTPDGKTWALSIFEKAKRSYHSVSYNSVHELLKS